nr:S1C family serine protease [uncultured Holophaga sp.]
MGMVSGWGSRCGLVALLVAGGMAMAGSLRARAGEKPVHAGGRYAEDFSALSASARRQGEGGQTAFCYCVRSQATYEGLSYASDGSIETSRRIAIAHGTAFGLRRDRRGTFLVTNDHVAQWPQVTTEEHPVEGVPPGWKLVSDSLRIVDGESDTFGPDDIPLTRVASDHTLDLAILKANTVLHVLPFPIGHSRALRPRDVVEVRGFPLGAFKATCTGKVITTEDHDTYGDWDHMDFVVDAQLSSGNSGSPVLAVSRITGQYELVGVYHAAYTQGPGLNVVVGIDQARSFLETFRVPVRRSLVEPAVDGGTWKSLQAAALGRELFLPFGRLLAGLRTRSDGALIFEVFSDDFPIAGTPVLVVEVLPPLQPGAFGRPGRCWLGSLYGLKACAGASLSEAETQLVEKVRQELPRVALELLAYQHLAADADCSKAQSELAARSLRNLRQRGARERGLVRSLLRLVEERGPSRGEAVADPREVFGPVPH